MALDVPQQQCTVPGSALFARLREEAAQSPELALNCAPALSTTAQRDYIQREAFLVLALNDPARAARFVTPLLEQPWLEQAGYFSLSRIATALLPGDPGAARSVAMIAARAHPDVALRETGQQALPFSREIFETAALAAPDEAVGLSYGASTTSSAIRRALSASTSPELKVLAILASEESVGILVRQRAALFAREIAAGRLTVARALSLAGSDAFFPALVSLRSAAPDPGLVDRALEKYAQVLFRSSPSAAELGRFSALDLCLLLSYGRTEEDDRTFVSIFDKLLGPKLRAAPTLRRMDAAQLRRFLSAAAAHQRLDAVMKSDPGILSLALAKLEDIGETVAVASLLDGMTVPQHLAEFGRAVIAGYVRTRSPYYGLLAMIAPAQRPADERLKQIAAHYRRDDARQRLLDTSALFDSKGACLELQLFYDDDDGVESFESFRQAYSGSQDWRWEDHGFYVRVSRSSWPRTVEILANKPTSKPGNEDTRHLLAKLLADSGRVPSVVIHRGHSYWVDRSLAYLPASARLVYLGSCRGLEAIAAVARIAPRAQIVLTRSTGTLSVNDPLMKALNEELLRNERNLDWDVFWSRLEKRFGNDRAFRSYVPPNRNNAAILLAVYYSMLEAGESL
jgi:hypothetical protein